MANEKILIVDDEKPINDLLASYMLKEQFVPFQAYNGEQALELLKNENPDLILLDVMLPDIDGTALCLQMRKSTDAPVLFVSCKSEELDKIIALSSGGDDYITKPFLPGELIARIKANLRRQRSPVPNHFEQESEKITIYEFPNLKININTHEVLVSGKPVSLTAKEFEILRLLVENPKKIFSAEQIFESIWKTTCLVSDTKTVMVYISTLRKKIEHPDLPKYIINLRGVGYIFNQSLLND